jgi:hypothetical protein
MYGISVKRKIIEGKMAIRKLKEMAAALTGSKSLRIS